MIKNSTTNPELTKLIKNIGKIMPIGTIVFIIITYMMMGIINAYFLPLPKFLAISSALILSFGRFLIVFTDFLDFSGKNNLWQKMLAGILTTIALIELWFSISNQYEGYQLPIFLNIGGIIILGFALELSFLEKASAYRQISLQEEPTSNFIQKHNPL